MNQENHKNILRYSIITAKAVVIVLALVELSVLSYGYATSFYPHLNTIKEKVNEGRSLVAPMNGDFHLIAMIAETKRGIRSGATSTAYYDLVFQDRKSRRSAWHWHSFLWHMFSYIHFNNEEIFYLWCKYAYFGQGQYIQTAAQHYFKKSLDQLNQKEYATLVTLARSPSLYKIGSDKLNKRVEKLLTTLNQIRSK